MLSSRCSSVGSERREGGVLMVVVVIVVGVERGITVVTTSNDTPIMRLWDWVGGFQ